MGRRGKLTPPCSMYLQTAQGWRVRCRVQARFPATYACGSTACCLRHGVLRAWNRRAIQPRSAIIVEHTYVKQAQAATATRSTFGLIPVPACTMIPDFYSTPGLFYRPIISVRPAGMRLQAAARQCPTREALGQPACGFKPQRGSVQRGKRWAHPTTALSGTKFSPLSFITSPRNNLGSGSRPAQCFGNLIHPQPYATGQTNRSGQPACGFKPQRGSVQRGKRWAHSKRGISGT
jgi:hypothetical protein